MAAQSLHRSQSYLGQYFRRMRTRLGTPAAITAAAHKLTRILYHLISTRQQYHEATFAEMNEVARKRQFLRLAKQEANFGYQLAHVGSVTAPDGLVCARFSASTKIHATVDALGNPTGFHLTGGQACDLEGADMLLPQLEADILLADKGFDADQRVVIPWQGAGKVVLIPPKANRKVQRDYDKELYKARHLIENFFAKLKLFRAMATRYDKTARNFLAAVYAAAASIWLI
jgi:transposase